MTGTPHALSSAELLLHPVRLRVVKAFLADRELTTTDLRRELPDVPTATLYRQVATLADAGVVETVRERRVRGTVERTYRLRPLAASVDGATAAVMAPAEHRRAFLVFVAGLLDDFDRYLDADGGDLARDVAGYRHNAFYATEEEATRFVVALRTLFAAHAGHGPGPGRRRRLLSTVLLPAADES